MNLRSWLSQVGGISALAFVLVLAACGGSPATTETTDAVAASSPTASSPSTSAEQPISEPIDADDAAPAALAFDDATELAESPIAACLDQAGMSFDVSPPRAEIDTIVDELFDCAAPVDIGSAFAEVIAEDYSMFITDDGISCFADRFTTRDHARNMLIFGQPDATEEERTPIGELVGDCVTLSSALAAFGMPVSPAATACVDDIGRPVLVAAAVEDTIPNVQAVLGEIAPCLSET